MLDIFLMTTDVDVILCSFFSLAEFLGCNFHVNNSLLIPRSRDQLCASIEIKIKLVQGQEAT